MIIKHGISKATLASLGLVAFSAAHAAPPVQAPGNNDDFAPGRILVEPRAGLTAAEFDDILKPHRGKRRKIGQGNLHVVELPEHGNEKAIVQKLARNPHIRFAEVDRKVEADFVPNDPYYGSEAHLSVIQAAQAWDGARGDGITIAILDTGVDASHPDLSANMAAGYNFYDNNTNSSDVYGHGTAVAGTAAAALNNGLGVSGVAGNAKIMPLRVSDASGSAYYSTISSALTWAADHGARVANISFSGVAGSASIQTAAQYMKNKGGLVVVSAGNSGSDPGTPQTSTMIPVSATDYADNRTSWSSYGAYVAMAAPGIVYTTSRGGLYQQWQGTSFSSPLTAGVVALMMSANSTLAAATVENLLYTTAVDLGTPGRDVYYGYGRVNAAAAVAAARGSQSLPDTQPPTARISAPYANSTVSGIVPVDVAASDNVKVARVELAVNGSKVAVDSAEPFGFSWDSKGVPNGMATLVATAFDAAGNSAASSAVAVNVANAPPPPPVQDTTAPSVAIINPQAGRVAGNVSVSINASDDSGAAGITLYLYIDGGLKAQGSGSALAYSWDTQPLPGGNHYLTAVAVDKAGNGGAASMMVTK